MEAALSNYTLQLSRLFQNEQDKNIVTEVPVAHGYYNYELYRDCKHMVDVQPSFAKEAILVTFCLRI